MEETQVEVVNQRVIGLERGHGELKAEIKSVEQRMDRGFAVVDQKMAEGFNAITSKLDAKTTPQWPLYTILVTVMIFICGSFGTVVLGPIQTQAAKHDIMIETLRGQVVTRSEHERMWRDNADDQRRTEERIRRLWEEVTKSVRDLARLDGQLHPIQK